MLESILIVKYSENLICFEKDEDFFKENASGASAKNIASGRTHFVHEKNPYFEHRKEI